MRPKKIDMGFQIPPLHGVLLDETPKKSKTLCQIPTFQSV